MNAEAFVQCAMCGTQFDPRQNVACGSCPLHGGCSLICCPSCGYETVDLSRSRLAGWVSALIAGKASPDGSRSQPVNPRRSRG